MADLLLVAPSKGFQETLSRHSCSIEVTPQLSARALLQGKGSMEYAIDNVIEPESLDIQRWQVCNVVDCLARTSEILQELAAQNFL